ncbi:MAG: hypothetical protein RR351_01245 [Christensenella sp.]
MTWEILAALIVIVGCLITLGTVLARLVRTLTVLDCTLKSMQTSHENSEKRNSESHERIFIRLDKSDKTIENHEYRIETLEKKG